MIRLRFALLTTAALLAAAAGARAADLPTKKAAPVAPPANCLASFSSWLYASANDCPLTYLGITAYGQIDVGVGYSSAASKLDQNYNNGVLSVISKTSNKAAYQFVPNGLSQSNFGVKIKEPLTSSLSFVGDVNFGFDPYTLNFSSGPQSLLNNNMRTLGNQTTNSDSSRAGQIDNTRAYIGLSDTTFGTLTVGRQYTFSLDAVGKYDPFAGSYAFSLIGFSSSAVGGTGYTEVARYNTSIKYLEQYNNFRIGGIYQFGGYEQGNGSNGAGQVDLGFDYAGFSVDGIYSYAKDAAKLSTNYNGPNPAGTNPNLLATTLADINAGVIAAKYNWNPFTVYGGYEYVDLSNPSDLYGATAAANGGILSQNGGVSAQVQKLAFPKDEILQVAWVGGKYAIRPDLDFVTAYYRQWQNNYSGAVCTPNKTAAIAGASPQGSNSGKCDGYLNVESAMFDYRPIKRVDLYAGIMFSNGTGGIVSGYIKSVNVAPTAGLRISF